MTAVAPSQPSDMEDIKWMLCPRTLRGMKMKSLKELEEIFQENDKYGPIEVLEEIAGKGEKKDDKITLNYMSGYRLYGQNGKKRGIMRKLLAYECGGCGQIEIGPPKAENDTSFNDSSSLGGKLGYTLSCSSCGSRLYENFWGRS